MRPARHDDTPLGKLQRAIRATLPQPVIGARVAILERSRSALVLELGGHRVSELAVRVRIERAPRAGLLATTGVCPGRLLEDPDRRVSLGEPIRCADRTLVPERSAVR